MTLVDMPRPISGADLRAANVTGVLRYVPKQSGSSIVVGVTAAELADLAAHGVAVALVYEDSAASWMAGGWAAGVRAGQWIAQWARNAGVALRCVYLAADSNSLSAASVNACLDGAASVLGRGVVGLYGFLPQLTAAHDGGHASWFWLCGHYSPLPWINVYQCQGSQPAGIPTTLPIAGQTCDVDMGLQPDWGQNGADMIPTDLLDANVTAEPGGQTAPYWVWLTNANVFAGQAASSAARLEVQVSAIAGALAKEETDLLAAIKAVPSSGGTGVTDAQLAALEAALTASVPAAVLAALVARLTPSK